MWKKTEDVGELSERSSTSLCYCNKKLYVFGGEYTPRVKKIYK
jgi:hypothetical protein